MTRNLETSSITSARGESHAGTWLTRTRHAAARALAVLRRPLCRHRRCAPSCRCCSSFSARCSSTLIAAAALRLLCCDTADADDADAPPRPRRGDADREPAARRRRHRGHTHARRDYEPEHALKPRLFYLDNLKSFLTAVVVAHHVGCIFIGGGWMYQVAVYRTSLQPLCAALLGLDQAYFMALFFFVSGYFTPSSYDRKGRRAFLRDKAKRLGLPFLAYLFVFGPLLDLFISEAMTSAEHVCRRRARPRPAVVPRVALPLQRVLRVLRRRRRARADARAADARAPRVDRRGARRRRGAAHRGARRRLARMPITFGSLPFDVLFFAGGVLAKRNDWLHNAVPELKDTGARGVAAPSPS